MHADGQGACAKVFLNQAASVAEGGKDIFLKRQVMKLEIRGNAPLTYLVQEFGKLVGMAKIGRAHV